MEVLKLLLAQDGVFLYAHQLRQSVGCCPNLLLLERLSLVFFLLPRIATQAMTS